MEALFFQGVQEEKKHATFSNLQEWILKLSGFASYKDAQILLHQLLRVGLWAFVKNNQAQELTM